MQSLAAGLDYFDLMHTGRAGFIATGLLHGPQGVGLVDPGPSSCLETLRAALATRGYTTADIRWILLTHIHLDHAGATGTLLAEAPHARVIVHERGVKHLADPSKLIDSATRLYGTQMGPLWGEIAPVPAARIDAVGDQARTTVAGHAVEIAYTPGHAWHHVSYWLPASRVAFVGDTAGMCRPDGRAVLPLTAPPDTDLEAWRDSTARILAWDPDVLFLTHFGPQRAPRLHYQALWAAMQSWRDRVAATLRNDGPLAAASDDARIAHFSDGILAELAATVPRAEAEAYALAGRFDLSWMGLARYLRKKAA